MAALITVKGPNAGRRFPLDDAAPSSGGSRTRASISNRWPSAASTPASSASAAATSSRTLGSQQRHVRQRPPHRRPGAAHRARHAADRPLRAEPDRRAPTPTAPTPAQIIRARIDAQLSNHIAVRQNPAQKLQVVLQIAQDLGHTLDIDPLLGRLLEHLLGCSRRPTAAWCCCARRTASSSAPSGRAARRRQRLPLQPHHRPQGPGRGRRPAQRGRARRPQFGAVRDAGVAQPAVVPVRAADRLGGAAGWACIQLDCLRAGQAFKQEDLEMLTAIGLQAASCCRTRPTTPSGSARSGCARRS